MNQISKTDGAQLTNSIRKMPRNHPDDGNGIRKTLAWIDIGRKQDKS